MLSERKGKREKETSISCPLHVPWPGIVPQTQACTLTRTEPAMLPCTGQPPTKWDTPALYVSLNVIRWECHLTLVVSFPINHNSSLVMRKTRGKLKLRDILQNIWPELLKTIKVLKTRQFCTGWVAWLVGTLSPTPIGCGFDPRLRHIREGANGCFSHPSVSLSLSLSYQ